ncbi:MAG: rod shape-determining protein MreC, partial [Acinetobacter sp.]|nr:rod shape-determining protein MreC [Acinetobacter sp.]
MQPNIFSRQPPSFRSFIIAVITCLVVLFFDWRMPYVIQPARDVLYAAYNPIYALASYPVLSREWLNQQTKSETQLRRENTAMQAELLQAQVRLQKLSELSAENTRLRGLLDTPLIIDGRMEIAEVIGTDADPLRHIIIINRGSMDHLKVGQTVLDDKGIMGQIINVYPHSSRVMLLSDKEHSLSVRLERTGFFKTVDIKPARIPNSPDQVDLNVNVEEQHSGTTTLAVGYSQNGGITFQAGLSQTNFMGTGNRVAIDLSRSETQD